MNSAEPVIYILAPPLTLDILDGYKKKMKLKVS